MVLSHGFIININSHILRRKTILHLENMTTDEMVYSRIHC